MIKVVDHFYRAVLLMFFHGLALRRGVDWNQAVFHGELDQQVTSPEVPLDQDIISGLCLRGQPAAHRLQIRANFHKLGGNLAPELLELRGQADYLGNAELLLSRVLLAGGEAMVEEEEEIGDHNCIRLQKLQNNLWLMPVNTRGG